MIIKLYIDENVPSPVVNGLRKRGVDVLTAQEDGRERAEDGALLDRATDLDRLLVSRDRDFYGIAAARQAAGMHFRGVLSISRKIGYREAIEELEMIVKCSQIEEWDDLITKVPLG